MVDESGISRSIQSATRRFAWRQWAALGASTWEERGRWTVDPEALLVLTAPLGERDPRLWEISINWAVDNDGLISQIRLTNLRRLLDPSAATQSVDRLLSTLATLTRLHFPHEAPSLPFSRRSGGQGIDFTAPETYALQLRSVFGTTTRAEILRVLSTTTSWISAAEIADETLHTKRAIADTTAALAQSGIVSRRRQGNRYEYRLSNPSALFSLVGHPAPTPNWHALSTILFAALKYEEQFAATDSDKVRKVYSTEFVDDINPVIPSLRLVVDPPKAEPTEIATFVEELLRPASAE